MIDNIKWKVLFMMLAVYFMYKRFTKWVSGRFLLKCAVWFRVFLVIDFIFSCFAMVPKYNKMYATNFWFNCFYLVFLVIVFFLMSWFIKQLKKGDKNDT